MPVRSPCVVYQLVAAFSYTGWTVPRLGLKWSRSGSKSTMFVHNKLKRNGTSTEVLEAALAASAESTKEENVVNEV